MTNVIHSAAVSQAGNLAGDNDHPKGSLSSCDSSSGDGKSYIPPSLFLKSLCDVWDDEREVRPARGRTLFKHRLHRDAELFAKAFGYVRQYYQTAVARSPGPSVARPPTAPPAPPPFAACIDN